MARSARQLIGLVMAGALGATPAVVAACLSLCTPLTHHAAPAPPAADAGVHAHHGAPVPSAAELDAACGPCCDGNTVPAAAVARRLVDARVALLAPPAAVPASAGAAVAAVPAMALWRPDAPRPPAPVVSPRILRI